MRVWRFLLGFRAVVMLHGWLASRAVKRSGLAAGVLSVVRIKELPGSGLGGNGNGQDLKNKPSFSGESTYLSLSFLIPTLHLVDEIYNDAASEVISQ